MSILTFGADVASQHNMKSGFLSPDRIKKATSNQLHNVNFGAKDVSVDDYLPTIDESTPLVKLSPDYLAQLDIQIDYYVTVDEDYKPEDILPGTIWCPGSLHVCFQAASISQDLYNQYYDWGIEIPEFPDLVVLFENAHMYGMWVPNLEVNRLILEKGEYAFRALDNISDADPRFASKEIYAQYASQKYREGVYAFSSFPDKDRKKVKY